MELGLISEAYERMRGLSLIELLLVMLLMASFALVSMAPIHNYLIHMRNEKTFDALKRTMDHMRWQAIAQNQMYGVCGSSDRQHCNGEWASGVIGFGLAGRVITTIDISPDCHLRFVGSLGRNSAIFFTPGGMTQGQQGHFYCENHVLDDHWQLDVKINGATVLSNA